MNTLSTFIQTGNVEDFIRNQSIQVFLTGPDGTTLVELTEKQKFSLQRAYTFLTSGVDGWYFIKFVTDIITIRLAKDKWTFFRSQEYAKLSIGAKSVFTFNSIINLSSNMATSVFKTLWSTFTNSTNLEKTILIVVGSVVFMHKLRETSVNSGIEKYNNPNDNISVLKILADIPYQAGRSIFNPAIIDPSFWDMKADMLLGTHYYTHLFTDKMSESKFRALYVQVQTEVTEIYKNETAVSEAYSKAIDACFLAVLNDSECTGINVTTVREEIIKQNSSSSNPVNSRITTIVNYVGSAANAVGSFHKSAVNVFMNVNPVYLVLNYMLPTARPAEKLIDYNILVLKNTTALGIGKVLSAPEFANVTKHLQENINVYRKEIADRNASKSYFDAARNLTSLNYITTIDAYVYPLYEYVPYGLQYVLQTAFDKVILRSVAGTASLVSTAANAVGSSFMESTVASNAGWMTSLPSVSQVVSYGLPVVGIGAGTVVTGGVAPAAVGIGYLYTLMTSAIAERAVDVISKTALKLYEDPNFLADAFDISTDKATNFYYPGADNYDKREMIKFGKKLMQYFYKNKVLTTQDATFPDPAKLANYKDWVPKMIPWITTNLKNPGFLKHLEGALAYASANVEFIESNNPSDKPEFGTIIGIGLFCYDNYLTTKAAQFGGQFFFGANDWAIQTMMASSVLLLPLRLFAYCKSSSIYGFTARRKIKFKTDALGISDNIKNDWLQLLQFLYPMVIHKQFLPFHIVEFYKGDPILISVCEILFNLNRNSAAPNTYSKSTSKKKAYKNGKKMNSILLADEKALDAECLRVDLTKLNNTKKIKLKLFFDNYLANESFLTHANQETDDFIGIKYKDSKQLHMFTDVTITFSDEKKATPAYSFPSNTYWTETFQNLKINLKQDNIKFGSFLMFRHTITSEGVSLQFAPPYTDVTCAKYSLVSVSIPSKNKCWNCLPNNNWICYDNEDEVKGIQNNFPSGFISNNVDQTCFLLYEKKYDPLQQTTPLFDDFVEKTMTRFDENYTPLSIYQNGQTHTNQHFFCVFTAFCFANLRNQNIPSEITLERIKKYKHDLAEHILTLENTVFTEINTHGGIKKCVRKDTENGMEHLERLACEDPMTLLKIIAQKEKKCITLLSLNAQKTEINPSDSKQNVYMALIKPTIAWKTHHFIPMCTKEEEGKFIVVREKVTIDDVETLITEDGFATTDKSVTSMTRFLFPKIQTKWWNPFST